MIFTLLNKKVVFQKFIILILSFIIFGIIYFIFCDDLDFVGINSLQGEIKQSDLNNYISKIEKKGLSNHTIKKLNDKIKSGNIHDFIINDLNKTKIKYLDTQKKWGQRLFDRMYFSSVIGTTLGLGHIAPTTNKSKFIIMIQLFCTLLIIFIEFKT
jgi:hypothetical protein